MAFVTYTEETLRPLKSKWKLELPSLKSKASLCFQSERILSQIYEHSGFNILARNYRNRGFEIDFIAAKSDLIIAVEVKSRKEFPHSPLVNEKKKNAIRRGLIHFIAHSATDPWNIMRLDLALAVHDGHQFHTICIETNI